jgi:hypothetical protein
MRQIFRNYSSSLWCVAWKESVFCKHWADQWRCKWFLKLGNTWAQILHFQRLYKSSYRLFHIDILCSPCCWTKNQSRWTWVPLVVARIDLVTKIQLQYWPRLFWLCNKMRSLARLGFILLLPLSRLWSKFDHMLDLVRSNCNLCQNCNKNLIISWTLFILGCNLFLTYNQNSIIGWTLDITCFGCNPCLNYDQIFIIG